MDVDARLQAVEAENQVLRARVALLEEALIDTTPPPIEFGLTASEASILGLLMKRAMVTRDAVLACLYRDNGKDEADPKIADVYVCKLRKKTKAFPLFEIKTAWGQGWRLTEDAKHLVRELQARAAQTSAPALLAPMVPIVLETMEPA